MGQNEAPPEKIDDKLCTSKILAAAGAETVDGDEKVLLKRERLPVMEFLLERWLRVRNTYHHHHITTRIFSFWYLYIDVHDFT